jgi:hypothetical protein
MSLVQILIEQLLTRTLKSMEWRIPARSNFSAANAKPFSFDYLMVGEMFI